MRYTLKFLRYLLPSYLNVYYCCRSKLVVNIQLHPLLQEYPSLNILLQYIEMFNIYYILSHYVLQIVYNASECLKYCLRMCTL